MKVFVTGATGFIGGHLVEHLAHEGNHIRALVRPETDATSLETLGVEIVRGDVRDEAAVERAAAGCQLIFHLAAKIESLELSRSAVHSVNVLGTANVARAAVHAGADRFVLCSSVGVYGRLLKGLAIGEDTEPRPDSPYGESKLLAERIVRSHHERDGLPVVMARLTSIFGPGATSWLDFFQSIAAGRFRLIGSGDNYYHLAEVSDAIEGLILCGRVQSVEGRTYVIAGPEPVRLRELVQMIGEEVGVTRFPPNLPAAPLHVYRILNQLTYAWAGRRLPRADRIDFFLSDRIFDLSRGRNELGYVPKVSMREAVRRTAQWFRTQGYL